MFAWIVIAGCVDGCGVELLRAFVLDNCDACKCVCSEARVPVVIRLLCVFSFSKCDLVCCLCALARVEGHNDYMISRIYPGFGHSKSRESPDLGPV